MKINWKKTEIQSDIGSNNIIDAYGDGGFTVSGKKIKGSICLFPDGWCYWQAEHPENISLSSLTLLEKFNLGFDVLLIGVGKTYREIHTEESKNFLINGVQPDLMTTGAACRTWNILITERRNVFAAILAI